MSVPGKQRSVRWRECQYQANRPRPSFECGTVTCRGTNAASRARHSEEGATRAQKPTVVPDEAAKERQTGATQILGGVTGKRGRSEVVPDEADKKREAEAKEIFDAAEVRRKEEKEQRKREAKSTTRGQIADAHEPYVHGVEGGCGLLRGCKQRSDTPPLMDAPHTLDDSANKTYADAGEENSAEGDGPRKRVRKVK